jgi:hypothetical protein
MFYQKDGSASGEAAEVTDIGKMGDKQRVGMEGGKRKPEPMDPAPGWFRLHSLLSHDLRANLSLLCCD